MTGSAKQSISPLEAGMDSFVANLPAMTMRKIFASPDTAFILAADDPAGGNRGSSRRDPAPG